MVYKPSAKQVRQVGDALVTQVPEWLRHWFNRSIHKIGAVMAGRWLCYRRLPRRWSDLTLASVGYGIRRCRCSSENSPPAGYSLDLGQSKSNLMVSGGGARLGVIYAAGICTTPVPPIMARWVSVDSRMHTRVWRAVPVILLWTVSYQSGVAKRKPCPYSIDTKSTAEAADVEII